MYNIDIVSRNLKKAPNHTTAIVVDEIFIKFLWFLEIKKKAPNHTTAIVVEKSFIHPLLFHQQQLNFFHQTKKKLIRHT